MVLGGGQRSKLVEVACLRGRILSWIWSVLSTVLSSSLRLISLKKKFPHQNKTKPEPSVPSPRPLSGKGSPKGKCLSARKASGQAALGFSINHYYQVCPSSEDSESRVIGAQSSPEARCSSQRKKNGLQLTSALAWSKSKLTWAEAEVGSTDQLTAVLIDLLFSISPLLKKHFLRDHCLMSLHCV